MKLSKRRVRAAALAALAAMATLSATACERPTNTVRVDPGGSKAELTATGRTPAPSMSVKDHLGRSVDVPAVGRITVLSFASKSTADRGTELCRAVRVAHPDVSLLEVMDLSSAPGFLAGKVKSNLADRYQTILADTTQAFTAAKTTPPNDLGERIHIVPDWNADAFKAYGATNADDEVQVAVIDDKGGLVSFFAKTPTADEIKAAVARAGSTTSAN